MGYAIGTVTGGLGNEAHYKVLAEIRTLLLANGWTELRYINTGADRELIVRSAGLSGTEDIFIGFKTYQSVSADYYNITFATFTGYVAENIFSAQPGAKLCGTPCHNNSVTYFMHANAQGIRACFKVGTPVYAHGFAGKFFPYARPGEYPAPLIVGGSFNGEEPRRFSDDNYVMPYYGLYGYANNELGSRCNCYIRRMDGVWVKKFHQPWRVGFRDLRPAGTQYQLQPIVLYDFDGEGNVWGELDSAMQITGFNNGPENVLQIGGTLYNQSGRTVLQSVQGILANGGRPFVVLQDGSRTDFNAFVALEMS